MRNKLIAAIDAHFNGAPRTAQVQELHDEILQNTLDRYDDEINAGKSEIEAYDIAVTAIGDLDTLLSPLCPQQKSSSIHRAIAIALYILCVVPVIIGGGIGGAAEEIGVCLMFVLAAVATSMIVWPSAAKATPMRKLRAVGIGMYVLCVVPTILFEEIIGGTVGDVLGVSLMFVIIALATVLVVISAQQGKTDIKTVSADLVGDTEIKAVKRPVSLARSIGTPLYWIAAAFAFSLLGHYVSWYFAWLVFPFAGAVGDVITGVVMLIKSKSGVYKLLTGILWLAVVAFYFVFTLHTEKWLVTWLVFPIGGAVNGILSGIFDLVRGDSK